MGYKLDLKNPQTFNEKLNWLKLYNRSKIYTLMADKYEVKKIIEEKIGKEYVVPCLGVFENVDDINWNDLPNQFVVKCTNDSSGVVVCRDKKKLNIEAVSLKLKKCMKRNYYPFLREWVYKDIKPKIIVDKFIDDGSGKELVDCKFMCFNGVPKLVYLTNKSSNIFENFYDMNFKVVGINHGFPRNVPEFTKPKNFELMKSLAEKLAEGIPFVRIDFFNVDGKVYFGECTFYDWGGMRPFVDRKWDYTLGEWIDLSAVKSL
jgi:hypothetical protein